MIFVNFKTYQQGTGKEAEKLVGLIEKIAEETKLKIIPVVQIADLSDVVRNSKLEVWVQHIDSVSYGANTGAILPEAVKERGASGSFLNHSEKRIKDFRKLSDSVRRAKEVGLKTLVFAKNVVELERVLELTPDIVAYEPPELVGSKTSSVSQAKPKIIQEAAKITKKFAIPLIVGAGIKSKEDVKISLSLGAVGIAVSSFVVESDSPYDKLYQLVGGFF